MNIKDCFFLNLKLIARRIDNKKTQKTKKITSVVKILLSYLKFLNKDEAPSINNKL